MNAYSKYLKAHKLHCRAYSAYAKTVQEIAAHNQSLFRGESPEYTKLVKKRDAVYDSCATALSAAQESYKLRSRQLDDEDDECDYGDDLLHKQEDKARNRRDALLIRLDKQFENLHRKAALRSEKFNRKTAALWQRLNKEAAACNDASKAAKAAKAALGAPKEKELITGN